MDTFYAGLDISSKEISIAIVDSRGKFVFETVCETEPESIVRTLNGSGYPLEKIGLESGNLTFWLLDELKAQGLNAICIDSCQMAKLLSLKVNKTDKNDARSIAEAMRGNFYKEVHHKTRESIEVGLQMNARRNLVDTRTQLKNNIRGHLKAYGIRLGTVSHKAFPEKVRLAIVGYEDGVQLAIEALLKTYEAVCENIKSIEQVINKLETDDPVIQLFTSIPGVGLITALTYKATIDEPNRFVKPSDVGCYVGLSPRQHSSGDTLVQGSISKRGNPELRSLLVECATVLLTQTNGWCKLKAWGMKLMKKKGLKKAAIAVARKLAVIMLLMWQRGEGFKWGDNEKGEAEEKKKEKAKSRKAVAA